MCIETPMIVKKNGEEEFTFQGKPLHITLKDFWSWACSDLLNNAMRSVLAEFLLSSLLKLNPIRPDYLNLKREITTLEDTIL